MTALRTLVVGASERKDRYAYRAVLLLDRHGHQAVPLGIKRGIIGETPILTREDHIGEIDTISLYIRPALQKNYYHYFLEMMPRRIIFNPGTENRELKELAEKKGIECLEACTLVMLATGQF